MRFGIKLSDFLDIMNHKVNRSIIIELFLNLAQKEIAKENDLMMQCRKLNLAKLNYDGEEKTIGKISADYTNWG